MVDVFCTHCPNHDFDQGKPGVCPGEGFVVSVGLRPWVLGMAMLMYNTPSLRTLSTPASLFV